MLDAQQVELPLRRGPLLQHPIPAAVVSVTGRCVLKRDPQSGHFVQYREWWDQSLFEVVKTAFNRPKV